MGLLLRYDATESVLRSVGDPPNGLLCMVCPDGDAVWAIDSKWTPTLGSERGEVLVEGRMNSTGVGPASTVVDVDDLVAGLEGPPEAFYLLSAAVACINYAVQQYGPGLAFEVIPTHVDLARRTRDLLTERGMLRRGYGGA